MMSRFFTHVPPPAYLMMASIGVNITDDFIRCIEFKRGLHGLSLGKYKEYNIAPGVIINGEIKKKEILVGLLKTAKKDFDYTFVRASLPEEKTYVFKTELPLIPDEAVGTSVEFKIQENVPLPPSESVFDYSIVGREKDHLDVSVTVVPRALVGEYTEIFKQAGFIPVSFKVESQAIARAIIPNGDMTNSLIINFSGKQTGFYLVSKGVVQFASTLKLGGDSLNAQIERHFKVTPEKAIEIKRNQAFAKNSENTELMYSISNSLSIIKDEVSKVQAYWRSNASKKSGQDEGEEGTIEKIILCGEDVVLSGIERYLGTNSDLHVEIAHVWENAFNIRKYIPALSLAESLSYAAAIGLALGPRRHIYV